MSKRKRSDSIDSKSGPLKSNDRDRSAKTDVSSIRDNHSAIKANQQYTDCPYLATINRSVLDFDMEKVCSVTLSTMNVYCCLVCGKFLSGRGKSTPAYTHSVQHGHFVYLNMQEERFYCLPDNYEILDPSLNDIKGCLAPRFTDDDITKIDMNKDLSRDIHGTTYLPGFMGMNDLGNTDYVNAAVRALSHVQIFRNHFLRLNDSYNNQSSSSTRSSPLVVRVGQCMRRLWSQHNFKGGVSPQELINVIGSASKKRFLLSATGNEGTTECMDFLNWFLVELHKNFVPLRAAPFTGPDMTKQSIITKCFQGMIEVTEQRRKAGGKGSSTAVSSTEDSTNTETTADPSTKSAIQWTTTVRKVPFNHLSLEIPPPPLFMEGEDELIIPQVPIFELLNKFNGTKWTETLKGDEHIRRKYHILKLPPYIIFHLIRISDKTSFRKERNPTIVTFPLRNLDMRELCPSIKTTGTSSLTNCPNPSDIDELTVVQLKAVVSNYGNFEQKLQLRGCDKTTLKRIVLDIATTTVEKANQIGKYNLLANICRDSNQTTLVPGISVGAATESTLSRVTIENSQSFKIHLQNKPTKQWYELEGLRVQEIEPGQVGVSEASILIYETQTGHDE